MYGKNRKNCSYCRYEKCLAAGMSPQLILTEEEKERIFKKNMNRYENIRYIVKNRLA